MSIPAFATLLERLLFSPGRHAKLALLRQWFETQPDPDRGLGLAAIAGELSFRTAKAGLFRELIATRTDPALFAMSYDYVGDLAETIALLWPDDARANAPPPGLAEVVRRCRWPRGPRCRPSSPAGWMGWMPGRGWR